MSCTCTVAIQFCNAKKISICIYKKVHTLYYKKDHTGNPEITQCLHKLVNIVLCFLIN